MNKQNLNIEEKGPPPSTWCGHWPEKGSRNPQIRLREATVQNLPSLDY
jgi:hypothetical protein